MVWLIDFSVRRPIAVGMLYCGLALLAWAAWSDLPVDVVPEGEFPEIVISTNWPGASPQSVQSLVTGPIESVTVTVPGVHKVTSASQRGASNVTVQFLEDVNLDLARFELADRLALLHDDLPPGIQFPGLRANLPRHFRELEGGDFYSFTTAGPATTERPADGSPKKRSPPHLFWSREFPTSLYTVARTLTYASRSICSCWSS